MNKFLEEILKILKKDKRLFSKEDNKLLKGELISLISKDDEQLLELLASSKEIEKRFFKKVGKLTIFQKENFLQLVTMNEFLPDSFTAFEIKIGLADNKKLLASQSDISLVFPHKDCILEGGQEKEDIGRDEIFYNTNLAPDEIDRLREPKVLTNWRKFDIKGSHKVENISLDDNLVIKGNNLLALYSLLQNYRNKIKLIYIDPPYNTGSDGFKYNDAFNHSSWLTFMKNRLEIAKDLLSEEGLIFIQCDDNEHAYLKVLMDELFGKENFRNAIYWHRTYAGKTISKNLPWNVDTILFYSKNENTCLKNITKKFTDDDKAAFTKDDEDGRGKYSTVSLQKTGNPGPQTTYDYVDDMGRIWKCPKKGWRMTKEKLKSLEKDKRLYITDKTIREKYYLNERMEIGKQIDNFWGDIGNMNRSKEENLGFVGQKPESLIKRILDFGSDENDIVLDFFAGTGTTGAAAHKMKRKYILIEQMDYIHDLPEARIKNVVKGEQSGISKEVNWKGGGSFVYAELLEWNHKYIHELKSAKTKAEIKKVKAKIEKEAFYKYQVNTSNFDNKEFDELTEKEQKKVLIDMLDMNHLYVNLDSIDDATFAVSNEDKDLNKKFYNKK